MAQADSAGTSGLDTDEIRRVYNQAKYQPSDWIGHAVLDTVNALCDELENARKVLIFADGLCVSESGHELASLYAEDCQWAQDTLRAAGCWPRGTFKSESIPAAPPDCFCKGLLTGPDAAHTTGGCSQ